MLLKHFLYKNIQRSTLKFTSWHRGTLLAQFIHSELSNSFKNRKIYNARTTFFSFATFESESWSNRRKNEFYHFIVCCSGNICSRQTGLSEFRSRAQLASDCLSDRQTNDDHNHNKSTSSYHLSRAVSSAILLLLATIRKMLILFWAQNKFSDFVIWILLFWSANILSRF